MTMKAISRFAVPELDKPPDDIREKILAVQEKAGFIPNIFLALAHRPDEFRAFFAYHDALMEKSEGLSKAEREMIVVATSGLNQCIYCVVSHGAILRIREKNPEISDQVSTNYLKADISHRQRVMLDFASKVCDFSHEVEDEDLENLKQEGFTEDEIWDIGAITGLFALSNRIANMAAIRPNPEFYGMSRIEQEE